MRPSELDAKMRALEYFHGLRLLPGAWTVLRVDGRGFSAAVGSAQQEELTGAQFQVDSAENPAFAAAASEADCGVYV